VDSTLIVRVSPTTTWLCGCYDPRNAAVPSLWSVRRLGVALLLAVPNAVGVDEAKDPSASHSDRLHDRPHDRDRSRVVVRALAERLNSVGLKAANDRSRRAPSGEPNRFVGRGSGRRAVQPSRAGLSRNTSQRWGNSSFVDGRAPCDSSTPNGGADYPGDDWRSGWHRPQPIQGRTHVRHGLSIGRSRALDRFGCGLAQLS
jgi:hypothetical protein